MQLRDNFTIKEIVGDYIVVPTGENYLDFGAVISINESGAFLWKQLQDNKSVDELSSALAEEYGIETDVAKADVEEFVALLKEHNLIINE